MMFIEVTFFPQTIHILLVCSAQNSFCVNLSLNSEVYFTSQEPSKKRRSQFYAVDAGRARICKFDWFAVGKTYGKFFPLHWQ